MVFDLFNALTSFQDYMNKILAKKLDVFVIFYLDDILIYTNETNHVGSIWQIFEQLKKHLLYIYLKKCCFHKNELQFFDYVMFL